MKEVETYFNAVLSFGLRKLKPATDYIAQTICIKNNLSGDPIKAVKDICPLIADYPYNLKAIDVQEELKKLYYTSDFKQHCLDCLMTVKLGDQSMANRTAMSYAAISLFYSILQSQGIFTVALNVNSIWQQLEDKEKFKTVVRVIDDWTHCVPIPYDAQLEVYNIILLEVL